MGKYDDLFEAAAPPAAEGKYSDLFDEPEVVVAEPQPEGGNGLVAPADEHDFLYYKTGKTKSEREALNAPLREAMQVPAVAPETITRVLQALNTTDEQGPIQQGIDESIARAGSGMTSSEGVASLPLYIFPPTAVGLQAENTAELPAQVQDAIERARQGDIKGAASTGTDALLNALMTAGVVHGGAKLMGGERIPMRVEPTLAERIQQPRVEPVVEEPLAPVTPETPLRSGGPPDFDAIMGDTPPEPMVPGPVAEAAPPAPVPVSPGAAKQLGKLKAYVEKAKKLGQQVDPKVTAKIAEIEGVPQEAASTKPDWVNQQIDAMSAPLEANGVANQIEALAAQRLTAKQIAQKLGLEPEQVSAVRAKRGIPSMEDRPGFEAWIKSRQAQEAPVQAQEAPSIASEAPGGVQGAETPAGAAEPPPPGAGATHYIGGVIPENPRLPIFTTTERTGAEWYARERGTGGQVHEIGVEAKNPLKLFNEQQVHDNLLPVLDEAGVKYKFTPSSKTIGWDLEIPDIAKHSPYYGENHLDVAYIPQVREALVKRGYDSIQASDVLENREIPTTVLIKDPSQMTRKPPPQGAGAAPPPEVPPSERGYAGMEPLPPEKTGISKAAIAEQREARGVPEIERQKQIDFGESLDRAKATLAEDPMAGQRLVDELTAKPRSVNPEDTPLLIERMQQVQREFDRANKAVNEATPEQLEVAKARLEHARGEYDKTVTATQNATSRTGAGLGSLNMILKEDYSLARMQSRKRAANNGKIDEGQLKEVEVLHNRITELSDRLDALDRQRFGFRDVGKEAVAARKSGKRLTDYTGEAATKARERIQRQLHGLGAKPAPPTLLYDYAVVGADHLARGLTKFSDWSAQMLKEFGEKVKPHLQDLWKMARAVHDKTAKAFRTPEEARLERYKTRMAKDTAGVTAKIQRGDFAKKTRQAIVLDKAAYKMKGNLQRLKNEFERGVAKDAHLKKTKGDRFWDHFIGVQRNVGKLSSPAVFQKLGLAAMVREVLAPGEAGGGYAVSKVFPRLAKGTRYGGDLRTVTRAEIKAKVAFFTEGMKDSWENLKGKETSLEALSDKYGRQPNFWYHRIGKIHAAIKAPVKRAEFVRSLETRMDAAVKAGEDINHPEVMDRLATESALDANRAIFQQNTVVSKFFSMADKLHPAAGRTGRFLFPVVKIPVNLFKELLTYNFGAPAAVLKIGHAYWKGVETLPPVAREAIIRQLVKGSVGGAAILWGYWNSDKVHDFFKSVPTFFQHTPIAMAIHEGSLIKQLEEQGSGTYYKPSEAQKEAAFAAKSSIPFMYTLTDAMDAITKPGGLKKWFYNMVHSTVVPQAVSWTAKELDKPTPFSIFDKTPYRKPRNVVEAVTQGIPGLREDIPVKEFKEKKEPSVSQRRRAQRATRTRARKKAREED